MYILLVDDDQDMRELAVIALGFADITVSAAWDTASALETFVTRPFDVVLCDRHLGARESVVDLIAACRQHAPGVLCVVLTGDRLCTEVEGVDHVVYKPVDFDDLAEELRGWLAEREAAGATP